MAAAEHACVVFGGDVVLARRQHYLTSELGVERVLALPTLKAADLAVVNLECVLATAGQQGTDKGEGGPYYFRGRPELMRILAEAGVQAVMTANNHSGDYGNDALLEQLNLLRDAGFAAAGTGTSADTAFAPVICRAGNLNIALFSVDSTQPSFAATDDRPGTAFLPLSEPDRWRAVLGPLIAAAKQQAHVVLVAVHWGPNNAHTPSPSARLIGKLLIDLGADGVLGSSAHVLQGLEIHRERPIIYDAGNLLFDAIREKPDDSALFKLTVTPNGIESVTFVPLAGYTGYTEERHGDDADSACRRYAEKCNALGTSFHHDGDGRMTLALHPDPRVAPHCGPAPRFGADSNAIPRQFAVGNLWQMASVPDDARCQPAAIGPLKLLGIRVWPKLIQRRQMLWIETFWSLDHAIAEDLRIDLRATPVRQSNMSPWGDNRTDHDPCDWMCPTSRWVPGKVYRDFYGLRPPQLRDWDNVDLEVSVGLFSATQTYAAVKTGKIVRLSVPSELVGAPATVRAAPSSAVSGWTAEAIQAVTGGTWLVPPPPGWQARSFEFSGDLKIHRPSMFVAYSAADRARHEAYSRPNETWDRHTRIARLSKDKAYCGALVGHPVPDLPKDFPLLMVDDPMKAALQLGRAARDNFHGPVVAITGTVGKSTTAAMLASMLGKDKVLTTQGNFNTRVGTVLALSNLSADYEAAVIETAQSSLWMSSGPITRVIRPTAAIVTSIDLSPSSVVKTVEDVAEYKSRIYDGLTGPKIGVVPDYINHFDKVRDRAVEHAARVVIFGYSSDAEVRIINISEDLESTTIDLQLPSGPRRLTVPVLSQGMAENAVAAFTMIYALGRDLDKAARDLAAYQPEKGRLQRIMLQLPGGGTAEMFDDSFNAEVKSMINAFQLVGKRRPGDGGRRIGILGRIVNLGELAPSMHASLAEPVMQNHLDLVVTHGPEMVHLREKLPPAMLGDHFTDAPSLVSYIAPQIKAGDIVLIKGDKRNSDFGSVAELLLNSLQPSA